jgi:hypothetical protein
MYAVPKYLGGSGRLWLRLDQTDEDRARNFNRTEYVSVIPESDKDFAALHGLRQDAESINRGITDGMYLGRAHSMGHLSQRMNMLGYALMVNSLTLYLAKRQGCPSRHPPATTLAA